LNSRPIPLAPNAHAAPSTFLSARPPAPTIFVYCARLGSSTSATTAMAVPCPYAGTPSNDAFPACCRSWSKNSKNQSMADLSGRGRRL